MTHAIYFLFFFSLWIRPHKWVLQKYSDWTHDKYSIVVGRADIKRERVKMSIVNLRETPTLERNPVSYFMHFVEFIPLVNRNRRRIDIGNFLPRITNSLHLKWTSAHDRRSMAFAYFTFGVVYLHRSCMGPVKSTTVKFFQQYGEGRDHMIWQQIKSIIEFTPPSTPLIIITVGGPGVAWWPEPAGRL